MASLNGKPNRKRAGHLTKREGVGIFVVISRKEKEELARVNSAPAPQEFLDCESKYNSWVVMNPQGGCVVIHPSTS